MAWLISSSVAPPHPHSPHRGPRVPARGRYFNDASSVGFRPALVHGIKTLRTALRYLLHRAGLVRSPKFMP